MKPKTKAKQASQQTSSDEAKSVPAGQNPEDSDKANAQPHQS
ncbi:MAG: hypothetical protein AAFV25_05110 [Bacteroidota bacterium]